MDFDLVTNADVEAHAKIKKSSDDRSIQIPEKFEGRRRTVALLALSFSASTPGGLVVPYARRACAHEIEDLGSFHQLVLRRLS